MAMLQTAASNNDEENNFYLSEIGMFAFNIGATSQIGYSSISNLWGAHTAPNKDPSQFLLKWA